MKIKSAEFITSAVKPAQWPKDGLPEVALIGRSNVGKSSLINCFLNRKNLAKTSSTPGKTRMVNFYRVNGEFHLVDLPGFGYAKVPLSEKKNWEEMVETYLGERANIKGALLILDARRDAGDAELMVYDWLERFRVPVITVFTKVDKLSKNQLSARLRSLKAVIPVEDPVLFSSVTGAGKVALSKKIQEFLFGDYMIDRVIGVTDSE
ncbi:MAG: YihA family ribosome biogenesis GTP-binding protein [Deltaproteobacteria bacterium]|nr:YihA family ribosome biogenesis GTP-binding protein [Deltaproteobacteria bacterium]